MSLAQLQANNEHVYKVVRERTKQGKPYSRRKASMSFVVAADKTITEKPEDEKLFLTHGDVVKLLEFFAWFATSKYLLLESLFGKKVPERGRAEDRRMSYSSWKASRGYGGRDSTATTWSKLAVPDAAEHIFRYAGKAGLVINESGDFQAHEQITVTELKIWLSSQGQNLFVPVVSFMRDRFLSLQFLPFELVRDLEERMNKAQTDGQMDPSDLVSPVIDLMPELTIPATICDIRGKLLRPHHAWLLNNVIPPRVARSVAKAQGKPVQALWSLLYSASEIGFSTQMFEKAVCGYLGSTMLLVSGKAIKDQTLGTPFVEQITLGAYIPRPWNAFGNTFGSEESKVFELEPFFEVFNSTMQLLDFARYSPQTGVSFGGHNEETARIRLDRDFRFGTYQQRPIRHNLSTYAYSRTRTGNRLKDFSVAFEILDIEIWALEGADARKLIEEADPLARARKAAANKVLHESEEEVVEHEEIDWDLMKQLDQLEPRKA
ncbi:TLD-domain-containing protein [Hyaloraphidium curvatum]|nr:TLD-domain-containing protein [Hyaloraphidium curvatum]